MINTNFNPFPDFKTSNFRLRQLTLEDDNEIFILRSNDQVLEYLGRPPAKNLSEARKFIKKINKGIAGGDCIYWVITSQSNNKLIGTICFWNIDHKNSLAEIGFELLPDYMGKGVMQEIIPVVIDFGFNRMHLDLMEGEVDPDNIKSIKLLEKFGFLFIRKLDETIVYTLKKDKYQD